MDAKMNLRGYNKNDTPIVLDDVILDCPFCGGQSLVVVEDKYYVAMCTLCDNKTGKYRDVASAAYRWNKRVPAHIDVLGSGEVVVTMNGRTLRGHMDSINSSYEEIPVYSMGQRVIGRGRQQRSITISIMEPI